MNINCISGYTIPVYTLWLANFPAFSNINIAISTLVNHGIVYGFKTDFINQSYYSIVSLFG